MAKTRYEEYARRDGDLPFVFHIGLKRTVKECAYESNWHENPELQLCVQGSGAVLVDGVQYPFCEGDSIAVDPDAIHYTYTEGELVYDCLIFDTVFLSRLGIDYQNVSFSPYIQSEALKEEISVLREQFLKTDNPYRTAELTAAAIKIAVTLYQNHSHKKEGKAVFSKSLDRVKKAVRYLRKNYAEKISLNELSKHVLCDKYSLSRDFKKATGQTMIEYLNRFRCQMAARHLKEGYGVAQAAYACGFENLSYFSKTFQKYLGVLPTEYKKSVR